MKLKTVAGIHPGYLNRAKIQAAEKGSHWLIQARDVEPGLVRCRAASLIRFNPRLSPRDQKLREGDVVFMARGTKNYAALLSDVLEPSLAAASFFIVRISSKNLEPAYLSWYLNQPHTQHYFTQNSGRGVHMPVVRRSVLEHLDIPLPPLATQKKISELFYLNLSEQELSKTLLEKRTKLIETVCLQAAEREGS